MKPSLEKMDKELHDELDKRMGGTWFHRLRSVEKTEVCNIWNPFDECWEESDELLRERIKGRQKK